MEWKIYAENEPADYASDFFSQKIAAYPIVETDVESPQIQASDVLTDYMKTTASSPLPERADL